MATEDGGDTPSINRVSVMRDLEENGYAVIPDVCSIEDCDDYIAQYRRWLSQFDEEDWPFQSQSIIQSYSIGHFENTWNARLKSKHVFASVWETEKLLTSFDAVAISFPPETQKHGTFDTGHDWLHVDQPAERSGLHAYQGALYLEGTSTTDYCFRVMSGSHKHFDAFYEEHETAARKSNRNDFYKLQPDEKDWFVEKGCVPTKVPVPKGGMVLWDSRTVHDNCKPEKGRPNSDRWRFVVFVCMTPAQWARPEDLVAKKRAYKNRLMTGHWPSQGINIFDDFVPSHFTKIRIPVATKHSKVGQSKEARLLAGDLEYNFDDGQPNGPEWRPVWKENQNQR